jgi:large subunit ribosomal protein L30
MNKLIKVKLTKSRNGCSKRQLATLTSLRLTKLNKVVEVVDSHQMRGMLKKVSHLVTILK